MGSTPSYLIALEGAIATGKTTFLRTLEHSAVVDAICEPLDVWRNFGSTDLLGLFYNDPTKYAATFQNLVELTQGEILRRPNDKPIRILERSPQSSLEIFVRTLKQRRILQPLDSAILTQRYENLTSEYPIAKYIYLKTDPKLNHRAAEHRKRPAETLPSLEYFKQISDAYDIFFTSQIRKGAQVIIIAAYDTPVLNRLSHILRNSKGKTVEKLFSQFAAHKIADRVRIDQLDYFIRHNLDCPPGLETTTRQVTDDCNKATGSGLKALLLLAGVTLTWALLANGLPKTVREYVFIGNFDPEHMG